jgi:hypothetical protein
MVTLSILITRVASIALTHTGLARQSARFQARSAFSGAGFTTAESDRAGADAARQRGDVTAASSLILAFVQKGTRGWPLN